ncbi:PREDICTED: probable WRKY transcription factor 14 [Nelumbo nucifera]|uniref:Probable WRKY transcription factor 14 n=1 Tax=Nelumbo nucifera TaxID=4432 RepID=A0A1U7Z9T3_NELNU|nr:PREDICTED: probable WRKY transcription factor 14 [Nelumbo nucifera]
MCSFFWQIMENDHGDLADIVRGGGGSNGYGASTENTIADWKFPPESANFPSEIEEPADSFGDPFSTRDPMLPELDLAGTGLFDTPNSTSSLMKMSFEDNNCLSSGSLLAQKIFDEEMRPCNIFSRMLQISPNVKIPVSPCDISAVVSSPREIKTPPMVSNDMVRTNSSGGCTIDNCGVQISSPRNPGIKRRKSQVKKVVCIPAPAAANSRPSGEVVPSDLWAWRKYGQKPIKGSPYPRGYYRCSSSKGCSARKQVERSRTDPNMLVITYTSEHNHPWPTQRNALAGCSRSQPAKHNAAPKNSQSSQTEKSTNMKEEYKESNNNIVPHVNVAAEDLTTSAPVKEEMGEIEKQMDMNDGDELSPEFPQSYRPGPPDSNQSEDFFADLGELEPDPLNLLLSQGFNEGKSDDRETKTLDPFSLFDWTDNSFGETKRDL